MNSSTYYMHVLTTYYMLQCYMLHVHAMYMYACSYAVLYMYMYSQHVGCPSCKTFYMYESPSVYAVTNVVTQSSARPAQGKCKRKWPNMKNTGAQLLFSSSVFSRVPAASSLNMYKLIY